MSTELDELQKKILNIAIEFDTFCKKNNIEYMLCGGTLLGSVRHQGFIPWDDDFDVAMSRDNFEKFIKVWSNTKKLALITTSDKHYYKIATPAKIYDVDTRVQEVDELNNGMPEFNPYGIFIDIFPLDYYPDNFIGNALNCYWGKFILAKQQSNFPMYDRKFSFRCMLWIMKFIPECFIKRITSKLISFLKNNKNNKKFVGYGVDTPFDNLIADEHDIYPVQYNCDFSTCVFSGPYNKKSYLSMRFGDYMELPPLNSRVQHIQKIMIINYENENVIGRHTK